MEHSLTYTVEDGTEYRLTYDNETGGGRQMHYLMHEDGVLKLECTHHLLPGDLDEEKFKSAVVPGAFFNCLGRAISEYDQKEAMWESGGAAYMRLAAMIEPHITLTEQQREWVRSLVDRTHDVELLVKVLEDGQVEQFSRRLNADVVDGEYVGVGTLGETGVEPDHEDEEDYVRPAYGKLLLMAVAVVVLSVGGGYGIQALLRLLGWM